MSTLALPYVGCQVAKEIYQRGITLEEYLGRAEH